LAHIANNTSRQPHPDGALHTQDATQRTAIAQHCGMLSILGLQAHDALSKQHGASLFQHVKCGSAHKYQSLTHLDAR
jgi:hypothetical protein